MIDRFIKYGAQSGVHIEAGNENLLVFIVLPRKVK